MSRVVINNSGIQALFANPRGPVAKIINQKADLILRLGRQIASDKFESRSGDLDASFKRRELLDPAGYHVAVGADAQHRGFAYARALETGINPATGAPMNFKHVEPGFMVPAVQAAGFRRRG